MSPKHAIWLLEAPEGIERHTKIKEGDNEIDLINEAWDLGPGHYVHENDPSIKAGECWYDDKWANNPPSK